MPRSEAFTSIWDCPLTTAKPFVKDLTENFLYSLRSTFFERKDFFYKLRRLSRAACFLYRKLTVIKVCVEAEPSNYQRESELL